MRRSACRSACFTSAFALAFVLTTALSSAGCQQAPPANMPAYVPANAAPPIVTVAASEIVGPVWQWQRTQLGSAPPVVAAAPERYTLSFQPGGRLNVRADCNRGGGSYDVNGTQMSIGAIALTRMGCPAGSQDAEFLRTLAQVTSYAVVRGDLVLTLSDGASMRFRPA